MARKLRKLEQVVEAALIEFQENGFTFANMDRISERAQVSKRTLYNYFESKEILFQEIVTRAGNYLSDNEPCVFLPGKDIIPQLHDLALRLALPYTDAATMKMSRLVVGEMLRNREMITDMLSEIELAAPAEAFFISAADAKIISKQTGAILAVNFHAFIKSQCFWPAILSGETISLAEVNQMAKSASEMFVHQFRAGS